MLHESDLAQMGEDDWVEPTWTQRDGTKIKIKDMSNRHLINTLRLIARRVKAEQQASIQEAYKSSRMLQGDMAIAQIEFEIVRLEELTIHDIMQEDTKCVALLREADKRRLVWNY